MKRPIRALLNAVAAIVLGCYGMWSWLQGPRARLPFRAGEVSRVLVIRLDLMGDAVFSIPTIEALAAAYPGVRIDCLALPYAAPIFEAVSCVAAVHRLDVNRFRRPAAWVTPGQMIASVRALRAAHYDLAIGLSGLMGGVFSVLSGARWRIGYAAETYGGCYNLPVAGRRYERPQHEVEYCLDLVRSLGIPVRPGCPALVLRVGEPPSITCNGFPNHRYAVLVPGATNGSAKRWPPSYWADLGDRLAEQAGLTIALVGSMAEQPLADSIGARMRAEARLIAGETSITELAVLLKGAALVVAGDTGPLHLAAALGTPTVGIFGPTDPTNTGPLGSSARVLRLGLACSPCYDLRSPADCKLPDRSIACMWGLEPKRVLAASLELLDVPIGEPGGTPPEAA